MPTTLPRPAIVALALILAASTVAAVAVFVFVLSLSTGTGRATHRPAAAPKSATSHDLPDGATVRVLTAEGTAEVCVHRIHTQTVEADGRPAQVTTESWMCDLPGVPPGTAFRARHAQPAN